MNSTDARGSGRAYAGRITRREVTTDETGAPADELEAVEDDDESLGDAALVAKSGNTCSAKC